jgi:precorrin-3B synthase
VNPLIRGACPCLSRPIPTGDGLLARLMLAAPMPMETVIALCEASEAQGNGILEVTNRGSLQIRGLSTDSAPAFAHTVTSLGLGEHAGPPILTSPLFGLTAEEHPDLRALLTDIRAQLSDPALASIGPKVSVLIDCGGALHLDSVAGDVRLRACTGNRWHLSIAGTAATAFSLGWLDPQRAPEAIFRILLAIARRGPNARARDMANSTESLALRASLAGITGDAPPPRLRPIAEPIGVHPLSDGRVAVGISLAFGRTRARVLKQLARDAMNLGAVSVETAPGRALLAIGLDISTVAEFTVAAAAAGFLVRQDDARRYVIACAGAPACRSGMLSTRELAPAVAEAAKAFLDGSLTIHVSGCVKGCAHPGVAALTLVGPDGLVLQGRAGDAPDGALSVDEFIKGVARLNSARLRSLSTLERSADLVSGLGKQGLLELMRGMTRA